MRKSALIIFGLFLGALILEALLRLAGFAYLSWQDYQNSRVLQREDKGEYRILCLGESTTALGGENSYPEQLERILNQKLKGRRFSVINKGLPGMDTTVIISELRRNISIYRPRMIIAMMGINDVQPPDKGLFFKIKARLKTLRVYKLFRMFWERLRSKEVLRDMYLEKGEYHLERQHYYEARELFEKVVELFPSLASGYLGLAKCYVEQGMYPQMQKMLDMAQGLSGADPYDYISSGWVYYEAEDFIKSESMFKKAIELSPSDYDLYIEMGQFYHEHKSFKEAEDNFKKAIELMPDNDNSWPYSVFGWHYFERGMLSQAEELLVRALKIGQENDVYMDMGFLRLAQGRHEEAGEFFDKGKGLSDITRKNFNILKDICEAKGIKLVCAQYPIRGIEDLKQLFDSSQGVIFVDNERIFKEAVAKGRFEDYFIDRFAGDFGHCTPRGNNLLANNIAEAIIREYDVK